VNLFLPDLTVVVVVVVVDGVVVDVVVEAVVVVVVVVVVDVFDFLDLRCGRSMALSMSSLSGRNVDVDQ